MEYYCVTTYTVTAVIDSINTWYTLKQVNTVIENELNKILADKTNRIISISFLENQSALPTFVFELRYSAISDNIELYITDIHNLLKQKSQQIFQQVEYKFDLAKEIEVYVDKPTTHYTKYIEINYKE